MKKNKKNMSNSLLRVGIAGYGVVGQRRKLYIGKCSNMKVVSVCDQTFSNTGKLDSEISYHNNYLSMLNSEELDAVFVCMTNDINPTVTIACLEKDIHVFCEKPPGRDVGDIKDVMSIEAQHPGIVLMYGFNHRYHESVKRALDIVRSGQFGKIVNLRGIYGKAKLVTFNQDDWRTKREVSGGGVLLDQGIHLVDLMRLFAGDFVEVSSYISNSFWGFDVEDNAYAIMRNSSGVVGMLHSSATQWRHRFLLEINLEKGSVNLSGILSGSKSYGAETITIVWANPDSDNGDPREQTTRYIDDPSWLYEITEFEETIRLQKPVTSGGSLDALRTMQLVYDIYKADPLWRSKYNIT